MSMEDTYVESADSDDEGQQSIDDIDAFERKMRGEAAPVKSRQPLPQSKQVRHSSQ